jgi:hypothetical protein
MDPEENFYELAAAELKNAPRSGLLTKCLAICEGNETKARAMYVRERAEELKTDYGRLHSQHAKLRQQRAAESMAQESESLKRKRKKKKKKNIEDGEKGYTPKIAEEEKNWIPTGFYTLCLVIASIYWLIIRPIFLSD